MGAGERRTVTVLFTDLVGSTEQRTRVGDDAADALRQEHDELVGGAVAAHRGEVVKSTGDGLLAVFGSSADALDAAVGAQQSIAARNRSADELVGMRAGLAIGDVSVEGSGDVFGTPVVEAARLCDAAGDGQVLCSDFVRAMAGTRGGHQFERQGELALKGLPEPVVAHAVAWTAAEPGLPFPAVLLRSQTFGFVGRVAELDELTDNWKRALTEGPVGVLVSGEPGSGKTRLVAQFAARLHTDGATVLAGRCDEGLGVPFQPMVEALRHWVAHTPVDVLGSRLGSMPGELRRLTPELGDLAPGLPAPAIADTETERYRLFEAVSSWLTAAATDRPIVLVIDDLHWATRATLQLLRHVLRGDASRLLVVGTYRETDLDRTHPLADLLVELRRDGAAERVALSGLGRADVEAFVSAAAGHALGDESTELAAAIHRETEGNPFFIESVLLHLVESGGVSHQDGRWTVSVPIDELGIPEGVREVIGRRLARLSEPADALLHLAALAGEEVEVRVLEEAADLSGDVLDRSLEEAAAAGLLALDDPAPGRARFSHALVRATLEDEVPTHRRVRLHRRLGEALETVHGAQADEHLPALARHFAEAAIGGDAAKAVEYLHRAATSAWRRLATEEAIAYVDRALEMLDLIDDPEPRREAELLLLRGRLRQYVGRSQLDDTPLGHDDLVRVADLAEAAGQRDLVVDAALAYGEIYLMMGTSGANPTRVDLIERALAALGEPDSAARADLLTHLALEHVFTNEHERRRQAADDSLAMARRVGDPSTLGWVLGRRPWATAASAHDHLEMVEEAYRLLPQSTNPLHQPYVRWSMTSLRVQAGHLDRAELMLEEFGALVGRIGAGFWRETLPHLRYALAMWRGDLDGARAVLAGRRELTTAQSRNQLLGNALERATEVPELNPANVARGSLIALDIGRADEARAGASFARAMLGTEDDDPVDFGLRNAGTGELFARLGEPPDPARCRARLDHYPDQLGYLSWDLPSSLDRERAWWAALDGDDAVADAHFEASLAFHAARRSPTNVAQDHRAWAWVRHLRGDAAGAREHVDTARGAVAHLDWPRFDQQIEVLEGAMANRSR